MTSLATHVHAPDGDVYVMTKSRFLGLIKRPHTSIVPRHGLGIQFRWMTDAPDTLEYVHRLVIKLMHDIPYADLRAVLNMHYDISRKLARIGAKFAVDVPPAPLPEELQSILPYVKSIT